MSPRSMAACRIDFSQMNRMLEINAEDLDCRVQAGVTREEVNARAEGHGPVLPDRSGRQCDDRRHGGDARIGHQRSALRHDARERAGPDRRHSRRPHHPHRRARAQVERGLRSHAPVRRVGRHARHHHRDAAAPLRHSGSDFRRGVPVSRPQVRRRHRDRRDADGHSRRAHRIARRRADGCVHPVFEARGLRGQADAVLRVPRHRGRRARAGGDDAGDRRRAWRQRVRMGDAARGPQPRCGRRGTTRTTPPWRCRPASRRSRRMRACRSRASPIACWSPSAERDAKD